MLDETPNSDDIDSARSTRAFLLRPIYVSCQHPASYNHYHNLCNFTRPHSLPAVDKFALLQPVASIHPSPTNPRVAA
ncbi:hypothetical protein ETAA8_29850 [Anatilimnocola aggregata]|uniref:Uncharacterized protein n=1 Tax=Anatilimnocola aggregata TaxID=2528021 RepID=A0A517YCD9_9BACT|nr:hypothetical protein ETAA8_29850 [Anatilimnocola aggregata]